MTHVLAIDPGVVSREGRGPACALLIGGELCACDFDSRPDVGPLATVVIERVHFRGVADVPKMPDLLRMMAAGYVAAGHAMRGSPACELVELTPGEWKGTEPKPLHHARLWRVLAPAERDVLGGPATCAEIDRAVEAGACSRWSKPGAAYYPRSFKAHNLLDACALGMFFVRRLTKR